MKMTKMKEIKGNKDDGKGSIGERRKEKRRKARRKENDKEIESARIRYR